MNLEDHHNCVDIDELLKNTKLNIEKFGLQVIMVKATDSLPSFSYSIGLWEKFKHPEVICFGLSEDLGQAIINDVAEFIKSGESFKTSVEYLEIFEDSRAAFLKVDTNNIDDYFKVAISHYESESFPAIELIWTDRSDKFPWEEGFDESFIYKQPLLDRNVDFKYREPKNLATFTTKQWVEQQKPILRVVHEDDGDWQFLTGDQMPGDIKIVALERLILRDKTLNEVFDLEYGEEAEREIVGGKWIRKKIEYDEE